MFGGVPTLAVGQELENLWKTMFFFMLGIVAKSAKSKKI